MLLLFFTLSRWRQNPPCEAVEPALQRRLDYPQRVPMIHDLDAPAPRRRLGFPHPRPYPSMSRCACVITWQRSFNNILAAAASLLPRLARFRSPTPVRCQACCSAAHSKQAQAKVVRRPSASYSLCPATVSSNPHGTVSASQGLYSILVGSENFLRGYLHLLNAHLAKYTKAIGVQLRPPSLGVGRVTRTTPYH